MVLAQWWTWLVQCKHGWFYRQKNMSLVLKVNAWNPNLLGKRKAPTYFWSYNRWGTTSGCHCYYRDLKSWEWNLYWCLELSLCSVSCGPWGDFLWIKPTLIKFMNTFMFAVHVRKRFVHRVKNLAVFIVDKGFERLNDVCNHDNEEESWTESKSRVIVWV